MQTALITGAASGIGRDTARLFASRGWQCVLVDNNESALHELGQSLSFFAPEAVAHVLRTIDLTDSEQIAALGDGLPLLDAIVNNAGMSDASNTPLIEQSPGQLGRLLALNLAAPAAVVDACACLLKPSARIVNVASGAGLHAIPWRGAYSPSKAGLIAQTQALARAHPEWCVTALAPGFVRTELVDKLIEAGRLKPESALAKIPLGRMAQPKEMAEALYFLASIGAVPLSGQILAVNGGSSIYGGSQALPPTALQALPFNTPLQLEIFGGDSAPWQALSQPTLGQPHYVARLDVSPLCSGPINLFNTVRTAAVRFTDDYSEQASLTLILPIPKQNAWQTAGDSAAARMLISTLACEWGSRALRINALEVPENIDPQVLHPLLRYVCGAAAQYLTGQTLLCHGSPHRGTQ